jgi:hypothetical protein
MTQINIAVCTLFEGHYHLGVGALGNSLSAAGFSGTLWAGHRGQIPPWASVSREIKPGFRRLDVNAGFSIMFVELETPLHFVYFKPDFLQLVLRNLAPESEAAIYIDPDIVIKCPWALLARWPLNGVALVQDVHSAMPPRHPMRLAWLEILQERGIKAECLRERYYSSGFVGISRRQQTFLEIWRKMIEIVIAEIGSDAGVKHGSASTVFHSTDQDALNMALMVSEIPVNAAGSESMDFASGGYLLSHAIGSPKPWQGRFIREALRGFPPTLASKTFFAHTQGPIRIFEPVKRIWLGFTMGIGAAIGRFYGRA